MVIGSVYGMIIGFGRNDYSTLHRTSNITPICYQLIERGLHFSISIAFGNKCINFEDFFSVISKISKTIRTNSRDHIVRSPTEKQLTAESFCKRKLRHPEATSELQSFTENTFTTPLDTKFSQDVTCSWSIKFCLSFCRCYLLIIFLK